MKNKIVVVSASVDDNGKLYYSTLPDLHRYTSSYFKVVDKVLDNKLVGNYGHPYSDKIESFDLMPVTKYLCKHLDTGKIFIVPADNIFGITNIFLYIWYKLLNRYYGFINNRRIKKYEKQNGYES
jgi:hypothetical protein